MAFCRDGETSARGGTDGGCSTDVVRADFAAEDAVVLDHFDDLAGPASDGESDCGA